MSIKSKIFKALNGKHALQKIRASHDLDIKRLGSNYGGWSYVEFPELTGSTVISAGLGEDASFDVEFAKKYGARIVMVDPTPRAISHFNNMAERTGQGALRNYATNSGNQPTESYDLEGISLDQLHLIQKALWNQKRKLKFFEPANPQHVSHSIINFQNRYRTDTSYIEVEAITLQDVFEEAGIDPEEVSILKLDIEGAEIEVIENIVSCNFLPSQILVEFDELARPSKYAYGRVDHANELLESCGYSCIFTDGQSNFLYLRG